MLQSKRSWKSLAAIAVAATVLTAAPASARLDRLPEIAAAVPGTDASQLMSRLRQRPVGARYDIAALPPTRALAPVRGRARADYNLFRSVVVPVGKLP